MLALRLECPTMVELPLAYDAHSSGCGQTRPAGHRRPPPRPRL